MKKIIILFAFSFLFLLTGTSVAFAAWNGSPYTPGATLTPECAPTDVACTVSAMPVSLGGTGVSAFAAGYIPFGAGTSALATSSTLYFDSINGRLGIGTANPSSPLTVKSTIGGVGIDIIGRSADVDQGFIQFFDRNGLTLQGAVFGETGKLNFMDATGSTVQTITAGKVGIGTTTPGSALDVKGTLRLSGATSGFVGFAPAAAAGSTTYTWPSADGTAGQVLSTNASGVLSWAAAGGSSQWTTNGSKIYYNTGNVGIGTNDPVDKLQVGDGTADFRLSVMSNTTKQFTAKNASGNSVKYGASTDSLPNAVISNNDDTALMTLLYGGNVGIGTTTPSQRLSVQGNGLFSGNLSVANITATGTLSVSGITTLASSLNGPLQANAGVVSATTSIGVRYGGTGLTSAPAYGQLLLGNASSGYTLTATSSLGLGTVTGSGVTNRVAYWNGTSALTSNSAFTFDSTTGTLGVNSVTSNPTIYNSTDGIGVILRAAGNSTTGQLRIVPNAGAWIGGATSTTYFQITNGQNNNATFMGGTYGADAPINRLQFNASSTQVTDLSYGSTPIPESVFEAISNTANKIGLKVRGATSQSADYLSIQDVNGTRLFNVASTGNVGIGTTSPWRTFSVSGTVGLAGLTTNTGGVTSALCLDSNNQVTRNTDNETCVASSARYKHNIETLDDVAALGIITALRPVTFEYKTSPGIRYGLIAEDVEGVDTRLVSYNDAGLPQAVRYTDIIPLLIKSVKSIVASITGFAEQFTTKKLCVGTTCVTEEQFKAMVLMAGQTSSGQNAEPAKNKVEEAPSSSEEVVAPDATEAEAEEAVVPTPANTEEVALPPSTPSEETVPDDNTDNTDTGSDAPSEAPTPTPTPSPASTEE